jgi:hypothetical protein
MKVFCLNVSWNKLNVSSSTLYYVTSHSLKIGDTHKDARAHTHLCVQRSSPASLTVSYFACTSLFTASLLLNTARKLIKRKRTKEHHRLLCDWNP